MQENRSTSVLNGRYNLLKKLGEGNSAVVYLADDMRLQKQVAIKHYKNGCIDYKKEMQIMDQIDDPTCIKMLEKGIDG